MSYQTLKEKLGNYGRVGAFFGLAGLAALVNGGCTQTEQQRRNTDMLAFGVWGAALNQKSSQYAAEGDYNRANSAAGLADVARGLGQHQSNIAAAEAGRSDVNVNVNLPQVISPGAPQVQRSIFTTEIYNLDTGKKEIEMVDMIYIGYFTGKKKLAKKYRIVEKINWLVERDFIVEPKITIQDGKEWIYFYREGKFEAGTLQ